MLAHIVRDMVKIEDEMLESLTETQDAMIDGEDGQSDNLDLLTMKNEYDRINQENIEILRETFDRIKFFNERIEKTEFAIGDGYIEDAGH